MPPSVLAATLLALTAIAFYLGRSKALVDAGGKAKRLHSLPNYYGYFVALWCGLPALVVCVGWLAFETWIVELLVLAQLADAMKDLDEANLSLLINDIRNLASGDVVSQWANAEVTAAAEHYNGLKRTGTLSLTAVALASAVAGLTCGWRLVAPDLRARIIVEKALRIFLFTCSTLAVLTTVGIVLSLLFEAIQFFQKISPIDLLLGLKWSPQTALREDQVGSSGLFGAVPLFAGTMLISFIAMCVAVPVGLLSAVYIAEYAPRPVRATVKPLLEVLAGIPTVVYGFFAAVTVAPFLRDVGAGAGFSVSSESALAAGVVMGIMIIPFVSSISDDAITAVPGALREGSLGLGATRSETIRHVVIPAALPGIVAGVLLAVSRAIGETMIVVMAAGLAANLTANPFEAVTTVTVQIVTLLVGDQEFDSAKTLAAFALGLVLFFLTLVLNVIALMVVKTFREQYE